MHCFLNWGGHLIGRGWLERVVFVIATFTLREYLGHGNDVTRMTNWARGWLLSRHSRVLGVYPSFLLLVFKIFLSLFYTFFPFLICGVMEEHRKKGKNQEKSVLLILVREWVRAAPRTFWCCNSVCIFREFFNDPWKWCICH